MELELSTNFLTTETNVSDTESVTGNIKFMSDADYCYWMLGKDVCNTPEEALALLDFELGYDDAST